MPIRTRERKGQHPSPATAMRMQRDHDEQAAKGGRNSPSETADGITGSRRRHPGLHRTNIIPLPVLGLPRLNPYGAQLGREDRERPQKPIWCQVRPASVVRSSHWPPLLTTTEPTVPLT